MGNPSGPTLAGFTAFVRTIVGINSTILPDSSMYLIWALANAIALVNPALRAAPCLPIQDCAGVPLVNNPPVSLYTEAVYNLAADNLFNYAQDLPEAAIVEGSNPPAPFFQWSRHRYNINGFVSGVIDASSDESTSQHLVVQDAAKSFTLSNLQNLRTPWGRRYLGIAQSYGPTTFGIS